MEKLLIIDDSEEIRKQLKWGLAKEYSIVQAGERGEGVALYKAHRPKVVTLDLGLPPHADGIEEGFKCLDEILKENPYAKVIIISGNDERENALKAVKDGAYDVYQKPIDLNEIRVVVKRAFHLYGIEEENRRLHQALEGKTCEGSRIIGQCQKMLEVAATIRKVASSEVSILIMGESGTGKELVSRAVHSMSLRKGEAFIPINCGAIPDNLLESELFGHEKGAFTGAHAQVQGKVEYAHKGSLFLDEIGELPANLQVKILRFLQEKMIQRVGGREDITVDARIIAATNVDIMKAIQERKFREDLYYRLGVITINLPPLREREGDIMLLSNLFLARFSEQFGKKVRGFSSEASRKIESYDWPGNVRELENRVQRAVIMSEGALIGTQDLGFASSGEGRVKAGPDPNDAITLKDARDRVEKEFVTASIERNRGNIARAAEELGISRPTLYDLMKKHGLHNLT
ncbi:MAG TPA: PEP-CTERM-box response regulator transcription factor [Deltaproteobacteria bacterium]|nr:MAG: PEP-CTERM-box response regulator transcription factor [Deltaproteobacteria bacterium GWA2_55_82]OGQ64588.1 MAG: PEP-CTERM-box response regulator transcription factor [Deltaproteobacteria bacterium RIFCSPLOWO2_02_FULL_55_12]OIJ73686.1 MAG: PEP-CTERM-box response regulator transcription factor [Deltaproteobacteria bacterium GWC2_55_46]HBG45921.1 PEP-CTERM-box response regulator transcription factor [Deltaproteobacteria bacterium]HCY09660.1 PEP-CTERM-box response regulator transcription fa